MHAQHERIANASQYYRVTERSFRALCPEASGHMNMGLWPAPSLRLAQEQLVCHALDAAQRVLASQAAPARKGLLDLGCGWGGSRRLFERFFPGRPYFGVNSSATQLEVAREANQDIPDTHYLLANIDDAPALPWERVSAVVSIEAAFHFADKQALVQAAAKHDVGCLSFLDICLEDPRVASDPLLRPSLKHAWSTASYTSALASTNWSRVQIEDLNGRVFPAFSEYLETLDERSYSGRRPLLEQLRRATAALVRASALGDVRYVLIVAER
jgi:hypothetical protein